MNLNLTDQSAHLYWKVLTIFSTSEFWKDISNKYESSMLSIYISIQILKFTNFTDGWFQMELYEKTINIHNITF